MLFHQKQNKKHDCVFFFFDTVILLCSKKFLECLACAMLHEEKKYKKTYLEKSKHGAGSEQIAASEWNSRFDNRKEHFTFKNKYIRWPVTGCDITTCFFVLLKEFIKVHTD